MAYSCQLLKYDHPVEYCRETQADQDKNDLSSENNSFSLEQ